MSPSDVQIILDELDEKVAAPVAVGVPLVVVVVVVVAQAQEGAAEAAEELQCTSVLFII
jgi:hypothetical protein